MVEKYNFKAKFWPFLENANQWGTNHFVDLNSASIYSSYNTIHEE